MITPSSNMSKTKTAEHEEHLDQAIDIINSVFNLNSEFYNNVGKELFESCKIPKLDTSLCSVDKFIKAALDGEPLEITWINRFGMRLSQPLEIKSVFNNDYHKIQSLFDNLNHYRKNQPLSDNLKLWGNSIQVLWPEKSSSPIVWSDISDGLQIRLIKRLIQEDNGKNCLKGEFEKKEVDFYYHINKSLLNAEYLFIKDYSKQLINVEENLKNGELSDRIPHFAKDFFILSSKMTELCERIRYAIGTNHNRRIEIEDHAEENANRIISSIFFSINNFKIDNPTTNSDNFLRFTLSVIEMTSIDHIYKATPDNIGKLLTLWERIKDVNGSGVEKIKKVVEMVTKKTATMIHKMVFDNGNAKSLQYLNIEGMEVFFKNSKDIKGDIYTHRIKTGLNSTISYKEKNIEKNFSKQDLDKSFPKLELEDNAVSDIKDYNDWVDRGQKHYADMSPTIAAIEEGTQNSNQVVGKIEDFLKGENQNTKQDREDIERFSPFFFISSICFVKKQLDKQQNSESIDSDLLGRLLNLMKDLLLKLECYIRTYAKSLPPMFRPYFEHSFYSLQNGSVSYLQLNKENIAKYKCKDFENSFFFASYYCNATNFDRLHDFYERYLLQFQSFSYNLSQIILKKEAGTIKDDLNTAKNDFNDAIKIQKEDIKLTQRSSLQTLGLFTAFLSFIVSTIGTFRVVGNLSEYIIYSLTFTLAVVLFAFLISDHDSKLYSEKDKPFRFIKYIVYVIVLFLLVGFSRYYYTNEKFSKPKEETKDGHHITIHNSSAQNSTVNLNDVVPNNADTIK